MRSAPAAFGIQPSDWFSIGGWEGSARFSMGVTVFAFMSRPCLGRPKHRPSGEFQANPQGTDQSEAMSKLV